MRLALALYRFTPFGGLERNALELALAARARGHRVTALVREWRGERPAGIEVRELAVRAWTNVGLDRAFARALGRELAALGHDALVALNRIEGADVFYAADPCLAATRGAPGPLAPASRRLRAQWERALAGSAEILLQCERERARWREHYGTADARLHVLPPGLRAEFLADGPASAPELRAELGVPPDALVALAVGSDFARKGLDRSLAALAALPGRLRERTWLVVAGAGRAARCRRLARALGLEARVRLLGGRADVLACYRAADLLLHPAREENTGGVLLEAASQGVPLVCTAECGFAPLVAEAGRVLASPFDAAGLARATEELLGDADLRAELGERGRALARSFPMERRTAAALDVIERVAAGGRSPALAARARG